MLVNERDTAFGMAHYDRPRASGQDRQLRRLLPDARRTSRASVQKFIDNLKFGADKVTGTPYSIGRTWNEGSTPGDGKDFGLVCFICWSDTLGGPAFPEPPRNCFTVGTRAGIRVRVKPGASGWDLLPPTGASVPEAVIARRSPMGSGAPWAQRRERRWGGRRAGLHDADLRRQSRSRGGDDQHGRRRPNAQHHQDPLAVAADPQRRCDRGCSWVPTAMW